MEIHTVPIKLSALLQIIRTNRPTKDILKLELEDRTLDGRKQTLYFLIRWEYTRERFSAQLMNVKDGKVEPLIADKPTVYRLRGKFADLTGILDLTGIISVEEKARQDVGLACLQPQEIICGE